LTIEDIQQEMVLAVLSKAEQFDPARGCVETFIDRVAKTEGLMLIRNNKAAKRGGGVQPLSLEAPGPRTGTQVIHEVLSTTSDKRVPAADAAEIRRFAAEVQAGMDELDPDMLAVARRLIDGKSVSATAKELEVGRRATNRIVDHLRAHFGHLMEEE
jgi:DNA-directed RNA polymerase specialized sigma24 family protein